MARHGFDRRIDELAKRQHGAFNRTQAALLGGSTTMCADRVASGAWVRLARGVYALASHPSTWRRQYKAAELSHPGSAIRGRPAALVHGLEGARVLRPQLVVPPGRSPRSPLARVVRMADVPTTVVDAITVTTLARTLFDLLEEWPTSMVERAFDGALVARQLEVGDCDDVAAGAVAGRRPHAATFGALIAERRADGWAPVESELEAAMAAVLRRLPAGVVVVRQARLPWWQAGTGRVDFLLPQWHVIVEADGRRWHARVADFDRDRWRDNVAQAHGHRVLRFTHAHLTVRPDEVLGLIVAAGGWRSVADGTTPTRERWSA